MAKLTQGNETKVEMKAQKGTQYAMFRSTFLKDVGGGGDCFLKSVPHP